MNFHSGLRYYLKMFLINFEIKKIHMSKKPPLKKERTLVCAPETLNKTN